MTNFALILVFVTSIELTTAQRGGKINPCHQERNAGLCVDNERKQTIRYFWNEAKWMCQPFLYAGCGGNGNNFEKVKDCVDQCKPLDGGGCAPGADIGYRPPLLDDGEDEENGDGGYPKTCDQIVCPEGTICKAGWRIVTCCNETVQTMFDEAHSNACPDGTLTYRPEFEPFVADSCDRLPCPDGYACRQINSLFAMCCLSDSQGDVDTTSGGTKSTKSGSKQNQVKCVDENRNCPYWAKSDQCEINPGYMEVYCRQSCNLCRFEEECSDRHRWCPQWKQSGECDRNLAMLIHCRKSCDNCDGKKSVAFARNRD